MYMFVSVAVFVSGGVRGVDIAAAVVASFRRMFGVLVRQSGWLLRAERSVGYLCAYT